MSLTTRGYYNQESYNQSFLLPGVFQLGVLTTRSLITLGYTTRVSYNQKSHNQGFLQPGVLQPGVLQAVVLITRGLSNRFLQLWVLQAGVLVASSKTLRLSSR